jgi:hypothetical protein
VSLLLIDKPTDLGTRIERRHAALTVSTPRGLAHPVAAADIPDDQTGRESRRQAWPQLPGCGGLIEPLLDTPAVALVLGVPEQTLRQWRCAGIGPDYIKLGAGPKAAVRYTRKDVEDFIAHHRHASAVRAFIAEDHNERL